MFLMLTYSHTLIHWWLSHLEQNGIQYISQEHLDMQTRGAKDWAPDPLICGQSTPLQAKGAFTPALFS